MNSGIFTGRMEIDSPKLLGAVTRFLPKHSHNTLTELYRVLWEYGICNEPIVREPGVSFNPLPGRIGSLLLIEGEVRDPVTVELGLLTLLSPGTLATLHHARASDAKRILETPNPEREVDRYCYIARDLDMLRHAHMSSLSRNALREHVSSVSLRLGWYARGAHGRLTTLVQSTFERVNKNL